MPLSLTEALAWSLLLWGVLYGPAVAAGLCALAWRYADQRRRLDLADAEVQDADVRRRRAEAAVHTLSLQLSLLEREPLDADTAPPPGASLSELCAAVLASPTVHGAPDGDD